MQDSERGSTGGQLAQAREMLLRNREALLVKFCRLLSLRIEDRDYLLQDLTEFNQDLTDYVALSHFEVVEPAIAETNAGSRGDGLLRELKGTIEQTTDRLLAFSDRYNPSELGKCRLDMLLPDLDGLGQLMAERFELEDKFLRLAER